MSTGRQPAIKPVFRWQQHALRETAANVSRGRWWCAIDVIVLMGFCLIAASALDAQPPPPSVKPGKPDVVEQILAAVSRQPLTAVPFIERRMSALLSSPLESRGKLSFQPGGRIEKLTTSPVTESVVVADDSITIKTGTSAPTILRLDAQPDLANQVEVWRALLAGDANSLRRHFDIAVTGSFLRWELKLTPIDTRMQRTIRRIITTGERGTVRSIETTAADGEVSDLTLIAR